MATAADEEDYDRAMEQAARQSGAMTDAVKAAGFAAEDLKTTRFNVSTNYESIRDRDGNYRQVFTGYQCSQGFRLAFPLDMKRLGQVLSAIAASGAQPELHIAFTVKDPGPSVPPYCKAPLPMPNKKRRYCALPLGLGWASFFPSIIAGTILM